MTEDEGPKPRYRWVRDKDGGKIFAGWDGDRKIARLERHHNGWGWYWNLTCIDGIKDRSRLGTSWHGHADTARLAAKDCEDAYDAAMAGTLFGMTPKDIDDMRAHEEFMRKRRAGKI